MWTDMRSVEMFSETYSAWLCGWESEDDMSKIWVPNADLMSTIDRLVEIFTGKKSLGEVLKPVIQGGVRSATTMSTGWPFQILRFPKSSFINSDDGKMMIYDQQIGQGCNWYSNSGDCASYNEFKSGVYNGKCGNEPWLCEACGTEAKAPLLAVLSCQSFTEPTNYCNDWCNVGGRWGCGIASAEGVTCDCSGCNGCPVCKTVIVGPFHGPGNVATANLSSSSFTCPTLVDQHNWLSGDNFPDRFQVSTEGSKVHVTREGSDPHWSLNLAFQCCIK